MRARLIALIVIASAAGCQRGSSSGQTDVHHYVDEAGQPLPRWDGVWTKLQGYYGSATPPHITLRRFSGTGGRFEAPYHAIVIATTVDETHLEQIIAHESSHLSLYDLTHGASGMEQFRFFDEGYADIVGMTIAGDDMADHKQACLAIARGQLNANNLSFDKVQRWSVYGGNLPDDGNYYAHFVGSSFVYFIIDSFGEKKLFEFFRDIGTTLDLDRSFGTVFGLATAVVEQRWTDYVAKATPEKPPELAEMVPANDASEVPVSLGEIYVKFSVPMMKMRKSCVSMPCGDSGVCSRKASWKDDRTLVINLDGNKLEPATTYDLELGSERCVLISTRGATLPSTHWKFTTKGAISARAGAGATPAARPSASRHAR